MSKIKEFFCLGKAYLSNKWRFLAIKISHEVYSERQFKVFNYLVYSVKTPPKLNAVCSKWTAVVSSAACKELGP